MRDFIPLWTSNSCGTDRISMLCATAPPYRAEHFGPFFVHCRDYYGLHTQFESLTARSHSSISQIGLLRRDRTSVYAMGIVLHCSVNELQSGFVPPSASGTSKHYSGAVLCTSRPQKSVRSCALLCPTPFIG
ncbi:hypothetical protein IEO21_06245 [Rhodonia placenta]|uniref:Uncharacterized protein n=1 Tax=Rhodonia placenta TaxID=104341 RepID=A0A8H7P0B8_9APHY|nr:hypothetical protein IEO21_06245 [Postia placenta]